MPVPHLDRPICEPVELRPGAQLRVRRVRQGDDAGASASFPHYHDVCELVLHRLHLASQRLLEGDQTVADIAYALGFATPSHFGDVFHRRFGMTPSAYRRAGRP